METLVPLTQVHDVWSSRPSLTNLWSSVHHLWRDLVEGGVSWPRAACSSHRGYPKATGAMDSCPGARAWGKPTPLATCTCSLPMWDVKPPWELGQRWEVELLPPPHPWADAKASRSDLFNRERSEPAGGSGLLSLDNKEGEEQRASLMVAVVLSFTAPRRWGSAVFSTEFLDKAQFFSEMWLWCVSLPSCDVEPNQALTFQRHLWFSCVLTTRRTTLLLSPSSGGESGQKPPKKIQPSLQAPPAHRVQPMGQPLSVTLERSRQNSTPKTDPSRSALLVFFGNSLWKTSPLLQKAVGDVEAAALLGRSWNWKCYLFIYWSFSDGFPSLL